MMDHEVLKVRTGTRNIEIILIVNENDDNFEGKSGGGEDWNT